MGKNIWYHTFDMRNPELVSQGLMLNMPAVYPDDFALIGRLAENPEDADYRFLINDPDPVYEDLAGLETTLYQTEISRRFSLISQPAAKAGPSGTVAFLMWKQGIVRQGGPADVYARRIVLPDVFDPAIDNPYDYANVECEDRLFEDGSNPRYVKGLLASTPICMSCTSIVLCDDGGDTCADIFPFNEYFDDIDMSAVDGLPKIHEWEQLGPDFGTVITDPTLTNFDDQSWENPYDVAKGHRGYISGDYIMMLYCWSPNWLANSVGHDNYNLYVRRSFDGGATWTTLPTSFDTSDVPADVTITADGTEFYEFMGAADGVDEYPIWYYLGPGEFEPARNVSLLTGTRLTVLDPRYSPTPGSIATDGGFLYPDDERDPSKFFITFEVGDNTTVEFGEATPLDMYYSRALNYGDDYTVVCEDENDPMTCYFDWLENKRKIHAAEAALKASPGGMFFYAIWNQWQEDNHENVYDSDAIIRRMLFLADDDINDDGSGGDGDGGGNGGGNGGGRTGARRN
jgi:hypothetical protein